MSIKCVIFDVGGVLLRTHDHEPRRKLSEQYNLGDYGVEKLVFNSTTAKLAQAGELTIHQLWDHIGDLLSLERDEVGEIRDQFWAGDRIDTKLIDHIRKIQKHYKTAIISNYTDELHSDIHNKFKIADAFDLITVSATERVTKPDPHIFNLTLTRLNVEPSAAVFVDDMQVNVDAANKLGIKGILFNSETIYKDLETAGVTGV